MATNRTGARTRITSISRWMTSKRSTDWRRTSERLCPRRKSRKWVRWVRSPSALGVNEASMRRTRLGTSCASLTGVVFLLGSEPSGNPRQSQTEPQAGACGRDRNCFGSLARAAKNLRNLRRSPPEFHFVLKSARYRSRSLEHLCPRKEREPPEPVRQVAAEPGKTLAAGSDKRLFGYLPLAVLFVGQGLAFIRS